MILRGEPLCEPMGGSHITATGFNGTDPPAERPLVNTQESSWSTTDQPRTKSPECDASRPGCFHGVVTPWHAPWCKKEKAQKPYYGSRERTELLAPRANEVAINST
jgi:hypothetical protein